METYRLEVVGLTRELPICPLSEHMSIAGFNPFSDIELTIASAKELLRIAPEHDLVITAESKGIPLAYEMSRQSGQPYILARKSKKFYMRKAIAVEVKSITTERIQTLYLDEDDMRSIRGRRVYLVDDVISTGESIGALESLVAEAGGVVVGRGAILAEGDAAKRKDIQYLAPLPLFPR